ncbi:uncharacterized protein LOC124818452 [Hydra vulgaris]|uniref:uncharacterized protein LOC124818452 n=1 Tax=Hydra vulgaris TaxID=6087 RepID=UPI001F5EA1B6|nr:uncharacterized protein LOC124818452 [Hydra vulgaris]
MFSNVGCCWKKKQNILGAEINLRSSIYSIISKDQTGEDSGDHCIEINEKVTCKGWLANDTSKFKIYEGVIELASSKIVLVCVIQCIANNFVIGFTDNMLDKKNPSFDYSNENHVININKIDKDQLFEVVTKDGYFFLRLYHDKTKIVKFNESGDALPANDLECNASLFSKSETKF